MKILIATQNNGLIKNGQAVFCVHLAEGLARRGFDVTVRTAQKERNASHPGGRQAQSSQRLGVSS